MNADASAPCDLLEWDTNFFRCRIARVQNNTMNEDQAERVEEWSRNNCIRGLYFLAQADDPMTIRTAKENNFDLVDIRLTFECMALTTGVRTFCQEPSTVPIRVVRSEDLPSLRTLAQTIHNDTRFFADSHFPRHQVEALYSTWIALECQGRAEKVFVATSPDNEPLGYVSCHFDAAARRGQIGLTGVSEQARGKGFGKALVLTALDWLASQNVQQVTVVTQGRNVIAQRLYQRCGFLTHELQLWYHKWYPVSPNNYI